MRKPLSEYGQLFQGKDYKLNPPGDDIPIYGTGGIMGYTSRHLVSGEVILLGRKGTIDNPMLVEGPLWNVDTVFAFVPNKDVDPVWLFHSIKMENLGILNEATGVPSVSSHRWLQLEINHAEPDNQKRIAEILSTADEQIQTTEALIAKHEMIKEGMLQDLFTRGIDVKTGEVRSEDSPRFVHEEQGADPLFTRNVNEISKIHCPKEWTILRVSDLFKLGRGRVISSEYLKEHPGPFPVYSSQTANRGVMGTIDTYDFEGDYITWTTDGANAGSVFLREGKFNCTNVCGTLYPSVSLDMRYCAWYLDTVAKKYVSYVGNPKLMNGVMANIPIPFPPVQEQQIIADCIESMLSEIHLLETELQKLMELKSGLMNDLLSGSTTSATRNSKMVVS